MSQIFGAFSKKCVLCFFACFFLPGRFSLLIYLTACFGAFFFVLHFFLTFRIFMFLFSMNILKNIPLYQDIFVRVRIFFAFNLRSAQYMFPFAGPCNL